MANELDYVTILPFIAGAATRGLPVKIVGSTTKSSGYAIISRPDIDSIKALKGKRIAINTFGSSADFAIYQLLSRNGLDPNKDVTLQAVAGSPDARFAALVGGSVDATVVNSPFEYRAEQRGFKTLLSVKETAEFVRIPIVGLSTTQRKIEKEPDEIVRVLRGQRGAILFLQNQREIGVGLLEKLLKLDHALQTRAPAVGIQALLELNHIIVRGLCLGILADFEQRVAENSVGVAVVRIHLYGPARLRRGRTEFVARIENVSESAHSTKIVRRGVQRFFERLFGTVKIAGFACFPSLANERIAQSEKRSGVAGIALEHLLVITDLLISASLLCKRKFRRQWKNTQRDQNRGDHVDMRTDEGSLMLISAPLQSEMLST